MFEHTRLLLEMGFGNRPAPPKSQPGPTPQRSHLIRFDRVGCLVNSKQCALALQSRLHNGFSKSQRKLTLAYFKKNLCDLKILCGWYRFPTDHFSQSAVISNEAGNLAKFCRMASAVRLHWPMQLVEFQHGFGTPGTCLTNH